MDLTLSKTQLRAMKRAKMDGGPFLQAFLAGVAAPLLGRLGFSHAQVHADVCTHLQSC